VSWVWRALLLPGAPSQVAVRRDDPRVLREDPFGRFARAQVVRVGTGRFGAVPSPAGPGVQRHAGQTLAGNRLLELKDVME